MQTFTIPYLVTKNTVTITDTNELSIKMGLRKKTFALSSLRGLYLKKNESSSTEELILLYEPVPGKKKKVRIYANQDSAPLRELADLLSQKMPGIDLRDKPEAEALKMLGAADIEKVALFSMPFIVIGVVIIATLPMLLHGLDNGHDQASVQELLAKKALKSRNLTLQGYPLNAAIEVKTKRKNVVTTRLYIPLVEPGWRKGKPVGVVLKTDELSEAELSALLKQKSFEVTLRNILWEGVGSKELDFFKKEYDLRFTKEPLLVELRDPDSISEMTLWLIIVGGVAVVMFAIMGAFWYFRYVRNM